MTITEVRWHAERFMFTMRLCTFIPHPPGMVLPRTACSQDAAEEATDSSETNLIRFSLVLYTSFQLFGNKRMEQSDIHQVIEPPWTKFLAVPLTSWVRINYLRTSVGRFCSCLHELGLAASTTCERGGGDQTVDYVVFQCLIHRPPHGLHTQNILDDETIDCLPQTCPKV